MLRVATLDVICCLCFVLMIGVRKVTGSLKTFCDSNPCLNNGICAETKHGFVCTCINGFLGIRCEIKSDECPLNVNINCKHGKCRLMPNGQPSCHCIQGYGGPFCEDDLQSCNFTPCLNNGSCTSVHGGYKCLCPEGFAGSHCQVDVFDIARFTNSCKSEISSLNGGKCWEGKNSTIKVSWGYSDNLCNSMQSCFNTDATVGIHYTDVQLKPVQMEPHQTLKFFTEDDAALYNQKFVPHILPKETTSPAFFLSCNKSNAIRLTHADDHGQLIVDSSLLTIGHHYFIAELNAIHRCEFGLRLNVSVKPQNCISPVSLSKEVCSGHGVCFTDFTLNEYQCKCHSSMTGKYCEQENPCARRPCKYGGKCQLIQSRSKIYENFICHCPSGRTGMDCSELIDKCTSEPCLNGGKCFTIENNFGCICPLGFEGEKCETNVDECQSNPCKNGASCLDGVNSFSCVCKPGFKGTLCEVDLNECHSNPCRNGSCIDGIDTFKCHCAAGYSGLLCDVELNECASSPCVNGRCIDLGLSYKCSCGLGFTGTFCEAKVDLCKDSVYCVTSNAKHCNDNGENVTCLCSEGFEGSNCGVNINDCKDNPCRNGGSCIDRVNGFDCICSGDYSGHLCLERKLDGLTTAEPEASFHVELTVLSDACTAPQDQKDALDRVISDVIELCNCSLQRNSILPGSMDSSCLDSKKMLVVFQVVATKQLPAETVLCGLRVSKLQSRKGRSVNSIIIDVGSDTSFCKSPMVESSPDSLHRDVGIVIGLVVGFLILIAVVSLTAIKFRNIRKERVSSISGRRVKAYVNLTYEGGWLHGFDDGPVLKKIDSDNFVGFFDPIKQDTKV